MCMPKWVLLVMGTDTMHICHLSAHYQPEPVRGPPLHAASLLEVFVRRDPDLTVVVGSREAVLIEAAMPVAPQPWDVQARPSTSPLLRALLELLLGSRISNVACIVLLCQRVAAVAPPEPRPQYLVARQPTATVDLRNSDLRVAPPEDLRVAAADLCVAAVAGGLCVAAVAAAVVAGVAVVVVAVGVAVVVAVAAVAAAVAAAVVVPRQTVVLAAGAATLVAAGMEP